jgi:hypothetical protein
MDFQDTTNLLFLHAQMNRFPRYDKPTFLAWSNKLSNTHVSKLRYIPVRSRRNGFSRRHNCRGGTRSNAYTATNPVTRIEQKKADMVYLPKLLTYKLSTTGAHRTLRLNGHPTRLNTPCCAYVAPRSCNNKGTLAASPIGTP